MPLLQEGFDKIVDELDASELFDESFYSRESGARGDRRELARHYLIEGERRLVPPSSEFDVVFYRLTNADVVRNGMSPLIHFLRHGRSEGRYPNRRLLAIDAVAVEDSGIFDRRLFLQHAGAQVAGLSEIESYLVSRDETIRATPPFDPAFYVESYADVPKHHAGALLHYLTIGRSRLRVANEQDLALRTQEISGDFVPSHYVAQFDIADRPRAPLRHFVLCGSELGLEPAPDFSVDYYARAYPDLRGKTPYFNHFVVSGRREGRNGRPNLADFVVRGERAFDVKKPTIVIANHEMTRTGAPLVGFMLGARLCERYNVITGLGSAGSLQYDFLEHSCMAIKGAPTALDAEFILKDIKATYGLDAIVLNSVETAQYGQAALNAGVPALALLHEFAEYTVPPGKMTSAVETADRVIVPAELVLKSLQRDVVLHRKHETNNVVVRAQGVLPELPGGPDSEDLSQGQIYEAMGIANPAAVKIVLGAGYVQMRKGIDLFVQTAAKVRAAIGDGVRFAWVGGGWNEGDLQYGAWVADMLRRLELERHVFFFNAQSRLSAMFSVADIFYLPSRLDPFPNVVLDAFKAGKPVVCFNRATGIAEHLGAGGATGRAVSFCDVGEAASAIVEMLTEANRKTALSNNVRYAGERFDFDDYVRFVTGQIDVAIRQRAEIKEAAERIAASDAFDTCFYDGPVRALTDLARRHSILEYAARGSKHLLCFNPRPGFCDGLFRSQHPELDGSGRPPLDLALDIDGGAMPATHRCVRLDAKAVSTPFAGRVAIHLHLFYSELASEFVEVLTRAESSADIFVTTTTREKRLEIQYAFRNYKGGSVRVSIVSNRGRDIGPMLSALRRSLRSGYDIVGHFHGKRTAVVGGSIGDRWREFLLGTLIGDRTNLDQVLGLFRDRNLGLIFAEDRHCIGWTENRAAAEALAAQLTPQPMLAPFPVFPLGTMFWARASALEPLWRREFQATDFPSEPVPYDGTVLHALERMLPAIVESTGHQWCTVHRPEISW